MTWPPSEKIALRHAFTRDQIVAAEGIERADRREAYLGTEPALAQALGIRAERVGSADVLIMNAADVPMFNRVAGIGVEMPATENQLEEAFEIFRAAGVPRFFVDLSPAARPIFLADWIGSRGLAIDNNWVKLIREAHPVPSVFTPVRIEEIGREHAQEFGTIVQLVFELPERMSRWAESMVGRARRRHFMAFDRGKPIATAGMYVEGEWASLGYAAVLPAWRGRGVQAALIAVRIRAAREAGCRWLSMDTAEDTLERPSYSLRNAQKMGFEVVYLRPNYVGMTNSAT